MRFVCFTPQACELDVLVLARSEHAPLVHAESWLWPPGSALLALAHSAVLPRPAADHDARFFFVIAEDVSRKRLVDAARDARRWRADEASGEWVLSLFSRATESWTPP